VNAVSATTWSVNAHWTGSPTMKCESIAMLNESTIATEPWAKKNGITGMTAPNAVARPVTQPSRNGDIVCSPIFSSSCTCSWSIRAGSPMICVASSCAGAGSMPFAS